MKKIICMFCWGWCWPVIRWEQEKFHVCPRFYGWLVFLELAAIRQSPSWLLTAGSRYHFISFDYHHIWETAPSEILIWLTKNNTQCRKLWPPPLRAPISGEAMESLTRVGKIFNHLLPSHFWSRNYRCKLGMPFPTNSAFFRIVQKRRREQTDVPKKLLQIRRGLLA